MAFADSNRAAQFLLAGIYKPDGSATYAMILGVPMTQQ